MKIFCFLFLLAPILLFGGIDRRADDLCAPCYDPGQDIFNDSQSCKESCAKFEWVRTSECFKNYTFEFRIADFQPTNSRVNKIYGNSADYEIEWATCGLCWGINLWINAAYSNHTGHCGHDDSNHERIKTRLQIFPLSIGLKRSFYLSECFSFYVGLGVNYTFLVYRNQALFNHHHPRSKGLGVVAKSGVIYNLYNGLYLDFFFDYYYTGLKARGSTVNVGGLRSGVGLGFSY